MLMLMYISGTLGKNLRALVSMATILIRGLGHTTDSSLTPVGQITIPLYAASFNWWILPFKSSKSDQNWPFYGILFIIWTTQVMSLLPMYDVMHLTALTWRPWHHVSCCLAPMHAVYDNVNRVSRARDVISRVTSRVRLLCRQTDRRRSTERAKFWIFKIGP